MENFETSIAELLEEEAVGLSDELQSFEAWDSLTVLSIIAFCDSEYSVPLSAEEIEGSGTVSGLKELVESKM
ncbi:acyl carrier protein [Flagellimonas algicola]|uniref:Acyl carrier protein n=1 Tax=Flagellimonas algicola TaxID=2583815 RepID=A0ABY2WMI4_9FLAO|nr:acyl carrier protein [Allomuricauda algicola]TMU56191.1 acyl carrier protein [Allomuricauda algicola]